MSEDIIDKLLKSFGLTETEIEVYIFLAKHGILKCTEISRQLRKDRAQSLRILKSLQTKGLVEATLESPVRYSSVPFEQIIDLSIKAKRDEAALIENTKNELLSYWGKIGKKEFNEESERFLVIEGERKIYLKISNMMEAAKVQISSISQAHDLIRGLQFGLFEEISHNQRTKVRFRFLTEVTKQNIERVKTFLKTLNIEVSIRARNPDLGLSLFPRMLIRDNEELLFFIKPRNKKEEQNDLCLWTNCTNLVQSFIGVFEDLWHSSTDIQTRIQEVENPQVNPKKFIYLRAKQAIWKYNESLLTAEKEIIMATSDEEINEVWKNKQLQNQWIQNGIIVKVMAPITNENLEAARQLSKHFEIKHVSLGYLPTTIIDEKHLFQFRAPILAQRPNDFEEATYTSDTDYIKKKLNQFSNIWENAQKPTFTTLESILENVGPTLIPLTVKSRNIMKESGTQVLIDEQSLKEKDILDKVINAKYHQVNDPSKDTNVMYASAGSAIIHPPKYFNLPDILLSLFHIEKQSSLGEEDAIIVFLSQNTKDQTYIPAVVVGDNPKAQNIWKNAFKNNPKAKENSLVLEKDEIQIRVHGQTLFAGWTVPIQLSSHYILPPACLLIEGYGNVKSFRYTIAKPSGAKTMVEQNYFDAFVTFFHPASKYSGPGTDGYFVRDLVVTIQP